MGEVMTARQALIRSDLEAWEAYINTKWHAMTEPMREFAMEQRKRHLKTLLKVQTEEFDRS